MRNLINYIYNIDVIKITKVNNDYFIKTNADCFILKKVDNINNLQFVIKAANSINEYSFFSYKFIINIYNEFFSKLNDELYTLININNDYNNKVDFIEMLNFYNKSNLYLINKIKYKNNWDILWESKIDYLINYIRNNKIDNKNLMPLFWYYIGMCENALLYIRNINVPSSNNEKIAFCHRRIYEPNIKLNFYNPTNFIVDLEVRDVAEYIKVLFLNNKDYIEELNYYLKINKLKTYSASMLYARIIYPSYFLDYFENKVSNIKLDSFFETKNYELFIKKTYELINSYVKIPSIEWIIDQR